MDGLEAHILLFMDAGVVSVGAMGPVPLTFAEIDAWSRLSGANVTPAEAATIRAMSEAFLDGRSADRAAYKPLDCRLALTSAAIMSEAT